MTCSKETEDVANAIGNMLRVSLGRLEMIERHAWNCFLRSKRSTVTTEKTFSGSSASETTVTTTASPPGESRYLGVMLRVQKMRFNISRALWKVQRKFLARAARYFRRARSGQ